MAVIYLSSVDGSDSDDGSTWALAKATLAAALTAAGVGGTVYVDNAHAETQATAMTLTSPGTAASPVNVLCASRASGAPPTTLATTATISTTSASNIAYAGYAVVDGVQINAGSTTNVASHNFNQSNAWGWKFRNSRLKVANTATTSGITIGSSAGTVNDSGLILENTVLEFGNASQTITTRTLLKWTATATAIAGTVPTTLFTLGTGGRVSIDISGVDLSAAASGKTLIAAGSSTGLVTLLRCKLGASVAIVSGTIPGPGGVMVRVVNCDSADTNNRYERYGYAATVTGEATIVRTGGASDGVAGFSRKIVTTANAKFYWPFASDPFVFWNEALGSVTVEIEVVTDGVTLTDAEAWVEVEYSGTSGFPLELFANDRAADILATPANQTTSGVTWTTTGLSSPVKQKLSVTFTTAEKGWVSARLVVAKASTTLYACPKILSTSYKQTMEADGTVLNHAKLPAAGEVQTGVTFGSDGTEFTGSFSGGGGAGGLKLAGSGGLAG